MNEDKINTTRCCLQVHGKYCVAYFCKRLADTFSVNCSIIIYILSLAGTFVCGGVTRKFEKIFTRKRSFWVTDFKKSGFGRCT